jgi:peptidyl-prolyl cis-trans isomerase C
MIARTRFALVACIALFSAGVLSAQAPPPPAPIEEPPPPARDAIAARVTGQPWNLTSTIPELMIYRSLLRVPPPSREKARKDVLTYLVDNAIIDQYLVQLKVQVDPKEIDENVKKLKDEAVRDKRDFQDLLKKLVITEDELRNELQSALRWDKFVLQQGNDKVLQQFFMQNPAMFNGSRVRARHILIPVTDNNKDASLAKITAIKKSIDAEVAETVAKLVNTDALGRERERARAQELAFIKAAQAESTCPSKKDGGDLDFFPRVGAMVEPFARVAFALKPNQMSDPVSTDFGYHLILTLEFKEGKEVKFDQVKPFVQDVYGERLREAVLAAYKPRARIEILEQKK